MADARNSLKARDQHIWSLRFAILFVAIIALAELYVISTMQRSLTIDIPPDLSRGAHVKPGAFDNATSYSFAMMVWQNINDWPKSGRDDYKKRIADYNCYLTPNFADYLKRHYEDKLKQGELDRTRVLISNLIYNDQYVQPLGKNTFSIALPLELQERVESLVIKDSMMMYSLRVVPDGRACNSFGRSLDGFVQEPTRVEISAPVQAQTKDKPNS